MTDQHHHHQNHHNNHNNHHHNHHNALTSSPLIRYPPTNNSLLSSGITKKAIAYEPRTEAISPAINDDIINTEDSTSKSTKDEQTLLVDKLKKVEAEILQTDIQITRLRKQKAQLEQAANSANKDDDDQENVCSGDTKQLSIAKLVYHENRSKAQKAHSKLDSIIGAYHTKELPIYNQPSDNAIYHLNATKYNSSFKANLIISLQMRMQDRLTIEDQVSTEYNNRMEKWLESIERDDSQPSKRVKDAKTREFFEKQFPELKKARESGERFSRVGQRVARSDAEFDELLDGITEREDQDKKVKSYAVIPPMLEEMRAQKPKYINRNGFVEDIIGEYKEYQILNTWTDEEKDIFRENYLQHPKNFGLIASMTSRMSVANCVQYYYMSKKSENYKLLLKRQQKRRTRSFVRPAQQTPAVTAPTNNNSTTADQANGTSNDSNKPNGFNNNSKSGGDNKTNADESNSTNQSDAIKSSALNNNSNDEIKTSNSDAINSPTTDNSTTNLCCVCKNNFSENNYKYRNVTRSNYQLYGININAVRPGMKICYPCRFRHVKHPSFDEQISPEPLDIMEEDNQMEVDLPVIQDTHASIETCGGVIKPIASMIPNQQTNSSPQELIENHPAGLSSINFDPAAVATTASSKNQPRACVRDIIYQAIEMSFQKPKPSDMIETHHMKTEPIPQPEPLQMNPIIPHSISNVLPQLKPVIQPNRFPTSLPPISNPRLSIPSNMPSNEPPPPVNFNRLSSVHQQTLQQKQQMQLDYNMRQQQYLFQQLQQQQQLQRQQQQLQQLQQQQQQHQQQQQLQLQHQVQIPPPARAPLIPMTPTNVSFNSSSTMDDAPLNLCRKNSAPPPPPPPPTQRTPPASSVPMQPPQPPASAPATAPAPTPILAPVQIQPQAQLPPQVVAVAPVVEAIQAQQPAQAPPPPPVVKTPASPAREDSRSPNLTNSPPSPSEMVIDESADVQSPPTSPSENDESGK